MLQRARLARNAAGVDHKKMGQISRHKRRCQTDHFELQFNADGHLFHAGRVQAARAARAAQDVSGDIQH